MKTTMEASRLMITLPLLGKPRPSKSGKSLLVASSRGPRKASFTVDGMTVYVVANAYIRKKDAKPNRNSDTTK
jgi:hypothetical protein